MVNLVTQLGPEDRADLALHGLRELGKGRPDIGRYEIQSLLGEGGMGCVYRAWDRELKRTVAVKVLRDAVVETIRERFRREGQAMAGVSHPNVVAVYDAGDEGGKPHLVMELVDGKPLNAFMREGEVRSRVALLEKAARGVAAAHEKGIVHRDLKPANILVTPAGEPKVTDFGLARAAREIGGLTRTGITLGTPLYMAPEQVEGGGRGVSARTDVYALGAILYEMLTGRPPHECDDIVELYGRILMREPARPRSVDPRVPVDVETICLKALEKNPLARYAHAAAFADDLRRWLAGEPIVARPPSTLELLRRGIAGRSSRERRCWRSRPPSRSPCASGVGRRRARRQPA
jgi:serine/threonine-protein kinase